MEKEETKYIIKKLYKVFKDGYRPARRDESYDVKLKNGLYAGSMINCMGHIFNLRNKQFDDYKIKPCRVYDFKGETYSEPYFTDFIKYHESKKDAELMLDFIKETGLKVAECAPDEDIRDFKSWKIALYFSRGDFHYLLEDFAGSWSGKDGDSKVVEYFKSKKPPMEYYHAHTQSKYKLFNTYKITNDNADENNKYVKDRTL